MATGRLDPARPSDAWLQGALAPSGVRCVDMGATIATRAALLDGLHPDPADRMIVATALHLGVPLVTKDRAIRAWGRRHGLSTVW